MVTSYFETRERCIFPNIYAPIDLPGKSHLWSHINLVRSLDPFIPLILVGDFNDVTSLEEKCGGLVKLDLASNLLRDNICFLNLIDVKPTNGVFTSNNRISGVDAISRKS